MLKKIKIFTPLGLVLAILTSLANKTYATPSSLTYSDQPTPITDLAKVFENALAAVLVAAGFASFIMLIASGFKFITAQGDPKAMMSARTSIFWAIAGLAFLIIGWLVLQFIEQFTGVSITIFRLDVDNWF